MGRPGRSGGRAARGRFIELAETCLRAWRLAAARQAFFDAAATADESRDTSLWRRRPIPPAPCGSTSTVTPWKKDAPGAGALGESLIMLDTRRSLTAQEAPCRAPSVTERAGISTWGIAPKCLLGAHATLASTHDVERSNLGEPATSTSHSGPGQPEDLISADVPPAGVRT